jgi:hypothetical protein
LLAWPVVTLILFVTMSTSRAIIWSLLGAYLLLPMGLAYDFPGIPTLDKSSVPSITTFLLALGLARGTKFKWPTSPIVNLLLVVSVLGAFGTGLTNSDAISFGSITLPGMTLYATISKLAGQAIVMMPFLLGAGLLRTEKAHRDILIIFAVSAVFYTVPILMEIVKGPFLQPRIYGVDPGLYEQQMRQGGFRAVVFLGHGLMVSAFLGMAILAMCGLARTKQKLFGVSALVCAAYLSAILILNKSAGALLLTLIFAPLLYFLKPRRFMLVALAFAVLIVTYPMLRASGLFPIETIRSVASSYSEDRAGSLGFRLVNEEILLKRANERPILGWGDYGRNRVFVVSDGGNARDVSVTDGIWIITLGSNGWVGYLSMFGLLCYPFFHLFRMRRGVVPLVSIAVSAMLLFNLLDLIPNASLRPITWLLAGALAGMAKARPMVRPHSKEGETGQIPVYA